MSEGRQADWLRAAARQAVTERRPPPLAIPDHPEQSPGLTGRMARTGHPGNAMNQTPTPVGIDVSKAHLDVAARPGGAAFRVTNDPAGLAALVEWLRPLAPAPVVVEATGGYELPAVAALRAAGIPVAAVNPRQARDFARGAGRLAGAAAIDAAAPAHFAEAVRPEPRPAEPAERLALDALLSRRRQLIEMRVMGSNRLETCADPAVRAAIARHIAWPEAEETEADRLLEEAVRSGPARRERDELLRSIPGVGPVVSRTPLAALPELGSADGGRPAALAGLAPFARDSGPRRGPRSVRGGRPEVRRVLYPAALSAARRGGPLTEFAERLRARGKRAKVILVAVARGLLVIANAVLRTGVPWDPAMAMPRAMATNPTH
jgi:transposase